MAAQKKDNAVVDEAGPASAAVNAKANTSRMITGNPRLAP